MNRLTKHALTIVFVFSISAGAQDAASTASQVTALEQQVQQYLRQQKPASAIPLLRQIVTLDP